MGELGWLNVFERVELNGFERVEFNKQSFVIRLFMACALNTYRKCLLFRLVHHMVYIPLHTTPENMYT